MTRDSILQKLQSIRDRCTEALLLLETTPLSAESQSQVQAIVLELQRELWSEYDRIRSSRGQKTLSLFELSAYSPSVSEAWTRSGIEFLDASAEPDQRWEKTIKALALVAERHLA